MFQYEQEKGDLSIYMIRPTSNGLRRTGSMYERWVSISTTTCNIRANYTIHKYFTPHKRQQFYFVYGICVPSNHWRKFFVCSRENCAELCQFCGSLPSFWSTNFRPNYHQNKAHTHKNAMMCYWCIEILVKCQSRDSISLTGSKDSYLCWIALHAWFPVNNCCYWYRSCIVITSQRNKLVQSISLFMNFCLFNVLMRFIQKLRITVDCV